MSERPFAHEADCRFQDNEPEWVDDPPKGVERRSCMCGAKSRSRSALRIDPATQSPEPSKSAALHHPGCAESPETVTVERNGQDGGWRSHCGSCDATTLYWHEAVWDIPERGDAVLVTRAGNTLYSYRTADEDREGQRSGLRPTAPLLQ
jgi:hypothetical protein